MPVIPQAQLIYPHSATAGAQLLTKASTIPAQIIFSIFTPLSIGLVTCLVTALSTSVLYAQAPDQAPQEHLAAEHSNQDTPQKVEQTRQTPAAQENIVKHASSSPQKVPLLTRLRSLLGIVVLLGIAFLFSNNRQAINPRIIAWGLGLQFTLALLILKLPAGEMVFAAAKNFIESILRFTDVGADFVFGKLGPTGATLMTYTDGTSGNLVNLGFIFAFHVLPTIIFFGALMSVLYHLGIIQMVVNSLAKLMQKAMGTSGAESLSAAGNIFVGQTEAPLLIKPYVADMTTSELMAVMVGGFATVAGGVLAAYVRFGLDAGHLLAASVMSAPAALMVAKILYPETEESKTKNGVHKNLEKNTSNVIDAAATGATDGMHLAFNVAAMLIAFIALIAMLDGALGWVGGLFSLNLSLQIIFGYLFYPLSWVMGVDSADLMHFGNLLGTKLAVNEFVAYVQLGGLRDVISERSYIIGTYALCGFANFSSIGIQIGGISAVAPNQRSELARIGLKAMMGGAIASWLTACIAGLLL